MRNPEIILGMQTTDPHYALFESFIGIASGNDQPIWLLIDSEAAGLGGTGSREEVERGRCRGIDKSPSFIRRCSLSRACYGAHVPRLFLPYTANDRYSVSSYKRRPRAISLSSPCTTIAEDLPWDRAADQTRSFKRNAPRS